MRKANEIVATCSDCKQESVIHLPNGSYRTGSKMEHVHQGNLLVCTVCDWFKILSN